MTGRLALPSRWRKEPFRHRTARLAGARMISVTGSRASWIALVAVIYERSGGSGAWVSAALIT